MITFEDLSLVKPLRNAITELGFAKPTPIQQKSFSVVRSGSDVVGIAPVSYTHLTLPTICSV